MERNVQLFHDIAQKIEEHPENHDQSTFCGSACCVGGWAMLLSGEYRLETSYHMDNGWEYSIFVNNKTEEKFEGSDVAEMANLLGISKGEANLIYSKMGEPNTCTWPEALYKIAAGADVESTLYAR